MHPNTRRHRIAPRRIGGLTPPWAQAFLDGRGPPERDGPGWPEYVAWLFLDEEIPGLPAAGSYAGKRLAHARDPVPKWARLYRESAVPPVEPHRAATLRGQLDWHAWACWMRFGSYVPGLPDPGSAEGKRLLAGLRVSLR